MGQVIGLCVVGIVAISPLLRRLYMERFWIHGPGTVIRLEGGISTNPRAAGSWVWVPVIEYHAAGQRFSSRVSYWQRFNAKPKYSVGDEVDILYDPRNPSRVMLDNWTTHVLLTILLSALVTERLLHTR
jgi:Protein of unknown function (DUF3592)